MRSALRVLALGFMLLVPSVANATAPALSAISDLTLNVGATESIDVVAVDADADPITLTSSLPSFAVLNSPTEGTGVVATTISLNPLAADIGTHNGTITATAGGETDIEEFVITVHEEGADLAPTVSAPSDRTVTEGQTLTFDVTASDPDAGDAITSLTTSVLPTGASFTPNGTNTMGTFTWITATGQAGAYDVVFTASNALSGSATTHIVVAPVGDNGPVTIAPIDDVTVPVGGSHTLNVSVSDPDSGSINLSASGLPAFATLNPPTTSTGTGSLSTTITIAPGAGSAGTYPITLTATSDGETDTEDFTITVTDSTGGNTAPVVEAPDTRSVDEGQTLAFDVTATDADADSVHLTVVDPPFGSEFVDHGNGTGTFTWTPNSDQSGTYTVTFMGDDGNGGTDTDAITITVNDVPSSDFETMASLIGRFNKHKKFLCFRIRQEDAGFDLRNVTLSSIEIAFDGNTKSAMSGKTHVGLDCDGCFECDDDDDGDDHDGDRVGSVVADDDDGDHDGDCDEDEDADCDASHLRACFSMNDLRDLFGDNLPDGLRDAEIRGTLSTGETFIATIGGKHVSNPPGHDKNGGGRDDKADRGKKSLKLQVRPNPLNPKAEIRFTVTQAGPIRISLYDLNGRLVKTILDEHRGIGDHVVTWQGTSDRSGRVASGVYFLKVQAPQGEDTQRVTVLK